MNICNTYGFNLKNVSYKMIYMCVCISREREREFFELHHKYL
jgi:hypothetical protein